MTQNSPPPAHQQMPVPDLHTAQPDLQPHRALWLKGSPLPGGLLLFCRGRPMGPQELHKQPQSLWASPPVTNAPLPTTEALEQPLGFQRPPQDQSLPSTTIQSQSCL